jgi:hypothetical protein
VSRLALLSPSERLDLLAEDCPATGCRLFLGSLDADGYGKICINYKKWLAHRLVWTITNGDIPAGIYVCHSCDVPNCINPAHLWLGTHADNMADRQAKGRQSRVRGEQRYWNAKLTAAQVSVIRTDNRVQRVIAAEHGVSRSLIGAIKQGKHWGFA